MKRFILFIVSIILLTPLNAQHLRVMGVSLGMNMDDTIMAFKNKGCSGYEGREEVGGKGYWGRKISNHPYFTPAVK